MTFADAMELVEQVNEIFASKGKTITHIDLKKEKPDHTELAKVLLGPTGNLRAPTIKVGKKLLVGFDRETFETVFK